MKHTCSLASAFLVGGLAFPAPGQLTVTAVQPARNAVAAPTHPRIVLSFGAAVDPLTATAASVAMFGRWSGVMTATFTLQNADRDLVIEPDRPFFPGERVTVVASSAVRSASGAVLHGGHAFDFWTAPAAGSYQFREIARLSTRRIGEGRVQTYGAYAGDLDRDGTPDLSLPSEISNDLRVMYGDGCRTFATPSSIALPAGSVPSPNEGQDFNGDGWLDLAVGCPGNGTLALFLGDGAGGYRSPVAYPSGSGTYGVAVLDVEGDGDVDVVTSNRFSSKLALHRNRGDGSFEPATLFEAGGQSERGVAAGDANNDGWTDLFIANFEGSVTVMLADGQGGFRPGGRATVPAGPWMIVTGDVDGDGNVDAVTVNSSAASAALVLGDGAGGIATAATYPVGSMPIAVDLGDLDGDGDLDLVVSSYASASFTVYRAVGGRFGPAFTLPATSAGSCALVVDFDRDGDLDILGIDELDDWVFLFEQRGPASEGVQPRACTAAQRIDNLAHGGGFRGASPHRVQAGRTFHVGISGPPGAAYATLLGNRLEPGAVSPFGILNLGLPVLASLPAGSTNSAGEASQPILLPASTTPGATLTLQSVVLQPITPLLTNPEQILTTL